MNKNHISQSFDSFLKEENIEIKEEEIMQRIMNIKLMQKWDESSEDYKKRVLEYMKESKDEIKKNSLIYGFTCLDEKGKIIPNYKVFQINNKLIINESEDEK